MKLVSAAKLRRAQDAITQMRPYAEKLQEILVNVSASLDSAENPYAEERDVKRVLLVAITSNRGLCGPFNNNIIKLANQRLSELKDKEVEVLCLGKKAADALRRSGHVTTLDLGETPHSIFDNLDFAHTADIAEQIMAAFRNGKYDRVEILYNRFVNAAVQDVQCEQMLPIEQTLWRVDGGDGGDDGRLHLRAEPRGDCREHCAEHAEDPAVQGAPRQPCLRAWCPDDGHAQGDGERGRIAARPQAQLQQGPSGGHYR